MSGRWADGLFEGAVWRPYVLLGEVAAGLILAPVDEDGEPLEGVYVRREKCATRGARVSENDRRLLDLMVASEHLAHAKRPKKVEVDGESVLAVPVTVTELGEAALRRLQMWGAA